LVENAGRATGRRSLRMEPDRGPQASSRKGPASQSRARSSAALRGVVVRVTKAGSEGSRSYEIGVRLLGESAAALTVLRRVGTITARA
jgi:hypothetical protein